MRGLYPEVELSVELFAKGTSWEGESPEGEQAESEEELSELEREQASEGAKLVPLAELLVGELVLKGTSWEGAVGLDGSKWAKSVGEAEEEADSRMVMRRWAMSVLMPLMPESWCAFSEAKRMTKYGWSTSIPYPRTTSAEGIKWFGCKYANSWFRSLSHKFGYSEFVRHRRTFLNDHYFNRGC